MYLLTICMSSSEKNLVPLANFNYIVCFFVVVYLFESFIYFGQYFSDIWSANIPFHRLPFHFILSFALQKSFRLMQSHLFIFDFVACALASFKKIFTKSYVRSFSLMFFSRNFMISNLTFKYFKLIFINGVRQKSCFIILLVVVQFSQQHLLTRILFPFWVLLTPLSNIS